MKIRIITTKKNYDVDVDEMDFENIANKILEKRYIKLSENEILLTSAIIEIQRI